MDQMTVNNIEFVRSQIPYKQNYEFPYYAYEKDTYAVLTDFDHFPYKRAFRGIYDSSMPIILEREAGFRPRNDSCYKFVSMPETSKPSYCWQYPCTNIMPCVGKKDAPECVQNFIVPP